MRRVVLDAGALLGWFENERDGRLLRAEYERGDLAVIAPRHIAADVLSLLAARGSAGAEHLSRAGTELERLGFELRDPPVATLARWIARGLPADRAAYPALAESQDVRLATTDPELRRIASGLVMVP